MYRDAVATEEDMRQDEDESPAVSTLTLDQPRSLLINRTTSHAPSSASRTCRPIPSTD
jgi:hypothetical protein